MRPPKSRASALGAPVAALALALSAAPGCSKGCAGPSPAPSASAAASASVSAAAAAPASASASAAAATTSPARAAGVGPALTPQQSGTTQRLQAVSPVDARVVWASGLGGTYARSTDGGASWRARVVPGAEALQFRDVEGVSAEVAYLLAAGPGAESRVYKTADGGDTWALQFQNGDPKAFYDCFAFWSAARGFVVADSIDGRFPALATADGEAWRAVGGRLPPALPGEGAFAASGTCVATRGAKRAWFASSGAAKARVFATRDGGETWAARETPIVQGAKTSGGASVAFRDGRRGMLGGGDLSAMAAFSDNVARSRDGGESWQLAARSPFAGPVFGLSYALGRGDDGGPGGSGDGGDDREGLGDGGAPPRVVITGPGGAAWSPDEGDTWVRLEGVDNYWAVAFADARRGWLVGTEGRILKVEF